MNKKYDICEGIGCSKKAISCIQVIGGNNGDIILYLCKSCAKMFDDPLGCNTNKKTLEQAVLPERSNVHHIGHTNNPGVSLDD